MKTVILANVGTPQSTNPEDVGIYLRQFLMDENILPLPRPFRDILVKGIIVPRRKFASAEKYKKIWTDQGSPLMVETLSLQARLQEKLGNTWQVLIGMQVGKPSIEEAVQKAMAVSDEVIFVPLYPQFATATTGGAIKMIQKALPKSAKLKVLDPFFNQSWFLKAQAQQIRESLKPQDHLLLSYHGLPVSQLKSHRAQCYREEMCCEAESACAQNCYKAQCLKTSELLKRELNLANLTVGFQSRLGRAKWIEPSTDSQVDELLKNGVRHLKVACPSFVADCLETLEEIGMELRHQFLSGGGETFELIPCVNSHETFVHGLAGAVHSMSSGPSEDLLSASTPV